MTCVTIHHIIIFPITIDFVDVQIWLVIVTEGAEQEEMERLQEEEEAKKQENADPLLAPGLAFMAKMNQEEAVLVLGLAQK